MTVVRMKFKTIKFTTYFNVASETQKHKYIVAKRRNKSLPNCYLAARECTKSFYGWEGQTAPNNPAPRSIRGQPNHGPPFWFLLHCAVRSRSAACQIPYCSFQRNSKSPLWSQFLSPNFRRRFCPANTSVEVTLSVQSLSNNQNSIFAIS
jgi:hypothetical protein